MVGLWAGVAPVGMQLLERGHRDVVRAEEQHAALRGERDVGMRSTERHAPELLLAAQQPHAQVSFSVVNGILRNPVVLILRNNDLYSQKLSAHTNSHIFS